MLLVITFFFFVKILEGMGAQIMTLNIVIVLILVSNVGAIYGWIWHTFWSYTGEYTYLVTSTLSTPQHMTQIVLKHAAIVSVVFQIAEGRQYWKCIYIIKSIYL